MLSSCLCVPHVHTCNVYGTQRPSDEHEVNEYRCDAIDSTYRMMHHVLIWQYVQLFCGQVVYTCVHVAR